VDNNNSVEVRNYALGTDKVFLELSNFYEYTISVDSGAWRVYDDEYDDNSYFVVADGGTIGSVGVSVPAGASTKLWVRMETGSSELRIIGSVRR